MKINITKEFDHKQPVHVLGIFEGHLAKLKQYTPSLFKEVEQALQRKIFKNDFGSTYATVLEGKSVLVLSLGKQADFTLDKIRRSVGKAVKFARAQRYDTFSLNVVMEAKGLFQEELLGRAVSEGLLLSEYFFRKYLNKEKKEAKAELHSVSVQYSTSSAFEHGLMVGKHIAENTNFVKDLVNEQAAVATTIYMEKVARQLAAAHKNITLKVLQQPDLEKLGLNALVGVGKGGSTPPRLVFLEYKNGGSSPWQAIIGKGICFDSGGYNLKPTKYIEDMHSDMAGSAAVLGTIKTLAELGIKKNILGVMALAENMVSSKAQHPGDIVTAYNGKTIMIGNTDAEGRLVLCDALCYTEDKYKPEVMIDLATLTGACVVAFGYYAAGMMGNNEELQAALKKAGDASYDRVWQMPFFEEYQDWMDGTVTDLNNISTKGKGYEAGSITGGVFLNKFVEKAKWVHLDIAGTSYTVEESDYQQKFATGSGVRLLSYYFLD